MPVYETQNSDQLEIEVIVSPAPTFEVTQVQGAYSASVTIAGPQGPAGKDGNNNLVVSPTNPNLTQPGLWIQTFDDGSISLWVEDGV